MTAVHLLEVNLLAGLEQLLQRPGPHYLFCSPGAGTTSPPKTIDDLAIQLREEARHFHQLERQIALERAGHFEAEAQRLGDAPGAAHYQDAAQHARAEAAEHDDLSMGLEDQLAAVLPHWRLMSPPPPGAARTGLWVELCLDGYALAADEASRRTSRRAFLGLPDDADWLDPAG